MPTPKERNGRWGISSSMHDKQVYNEPSEVTAVDGDVAMEGPDGVDVALTPTAAADTSDRLLRGAVEAEAQRVRQNESHPVE